MQNSVTKKEDENLEVIEDEIIDLRDKDLSESISYLFELLHFQFL